MTKVFNALLFFVLAVVTFPPVSVHAQLSYAPAQPVFVAPKTVEFSGKHLFVQGNPFPLKGANDSVLPISTFYVGPPNGVCAYVNPGFACIGGLTSYDLGFALDQEVLLVRALGGNTIRTFDKITPSPMSTAPSSEILRYARQRGVMVIAGYWMNDADFTNPQVRNNYITDFGNYVNALRQDPNYDKVLMIGLSNENNSRFCSNIPNCTSQQRQQQAAAFYSLVNQMAGQAKAGDADPRPIMVVSGELGDIGDVTVNASDNFTPFIDAWGVNVYRGNSFFGLLGQYAARSNKPLVVSEFGMDAWDARNGGNHDPATQAGYVGTLWDELIADYRNPNGVSAGGCVFQIVDGWWKANVSNLWVPGVALHESGGWANLGFPDGQADEEYWGLFERARSAIPYFDSYTPRAAAMVTQQKLNQTW